MEISVASNVSGTTGTSSIAIKGSPNSSKKFLMNIFLFLLETSKQKKDISLLHSFSQDRTSAHTKIVVGTPNSHFIFNTSSVSARELLRKAVNVVEITIALVFVLLVKLMFVKGLVIKMLRVGAE